MRALRQVKSAKKQVSLEQAWNGDGSGAEEAALGHRTRILARPGTVKFSCFQLLDEAGAEGMKVWITKKKTKKKQELDNVFWERLIEYAKTGIL